MEDFIFLWEKHQFKLKAIFDAFYNYFFYIFFIFNFGKNKWQNLTAEPSVTV